MKIWKRAGLILLGFTLSLAAYLAAGRTADAAERKQLTVFYTNNNHGYINPCG